MMRRALMVLTLACVPGCAAWRPAPQVVQVPLPVACAAEMPQRPAMPTEHLPDGAGLDRFVAAAIAEIERREGYELQLRTALGACIQPLED